MNIEKLIQVVGYVLEKNNGVLNYTKLIKLLYLADRESIKETGYSITGDLYVSMRNGPVLSNLYDLIRDRVNDVSQVLWNSKFTTDGHDIHKVCPFISKEKLSDFEIGILDSIDAKFKDKTYSEMIDYVHRKDVCPEWVETNSSIPITRIEIMQKVGISNEDIETILKEEASYKEEDELLKSLDYPIDTDDYSKNFSKKECLYG